MNNLLIAVLLNIIEVINALCYKVNDYEYILKSVNILQSFWNKIFIYSNG